MKGAVEQLSVFLENRRGRLHEVTKILANAKVSIHSIELVEAGDFGILRLLTGDITLAKNILETNGISTKITPVIIIEIEDNIGCIDRVIGVLGEIDIQYIYTVNSQNIGAFVIKVDEENMEEAIKTLKDNKVKLLDEI